MPSTSKTKLASASEAQTSIIIQGEKGILQSVHFQSLQLLETPAICYVIIRLISSETPTPLPMGVLASGYCGGAVQIGWIGQIQLQPTYAIEAVFVARAERLFKLSLTVQR